MASVPFPGPKNRKYTHNSIYLATYNMYSSKETFPETLTLPRNMQIKKNADMFGFRNEAIIPPFLGCKTF